ncbi:hypothetical protein B0H12DRAFT_1233592 [Mycena haematopus]|nr:hypothetical protein B0H12DRAFT_1233592 [Mycena haematopus]
MSIDQVDLRSSVYFLSALASDFQKQSPSRDELRTNAGDSPLKTVSQDIRLLNYLSVVLSRGTRVVAVTSTPLLQDRNIAISVFSSPGSSSSTSSSSSAVKDGALQVVILPEDDGKALDLEVPDLFADFAEKSIRLLGVAAARMRRQTPADAGRTLFEVAAYFVKACFSKFRQRLHKVTDVYDLLKLADLDCAKFGDSLGQQHIRVKHEGLGLVLRETLVEDAEGFLFDKTTVALWWNLAIDLLGYLAGLKDIEAEEVTSISGVLHSLLYDLPPVFWRSQRLAEHLLHCRRSPTDPTQSGDEEIQEGSTSTNNTADYVEDEDEEESIDEPLPSGRAGFTFESRVFFRAVNAVLAWTTAASYLLTSPVARSLASIQLTVRDLPRTPVNSVEIPVLVRHWTETGRWNDTVSNAVRASFIKRGCRTESGACHCEAGLVADLLHRSGAQPVSGEDLQSDTAILLGVAKKCCPVCYILIDEVKKLYHLNFNAPGAHNTFHPWFPPESLPSPLLQQIEKRLLAILAEMAIEKAHLARSKSASSRARSDLETVKKIIESGIYNTSGVWDAERIIILPFVAATPNFP